MKREWKGLIYYRDRAWAEEDRRSSIKYWICVAVIAVVAIAYVCLAVRP